MNADTTLDQEVDRVCADIRAAEARKLARETHQSLEQQVEYARKEVLIYRERLDIAKAAVVNLDEYEARRPLDLQRLRAAAEVVADLQPFVSSRQILTSMGHAATVPIFDGRTEVAQILGTAIGKLQAAIDTRTDEREGLVEAVADAKTRLRDAVAMLKDAERALAKGSKAA